MQLTVKQLIDLLEALPNKNKLVTLSLENFIEHNFNTDGEFQVSWEANSFGCNHIEVKEYAYVVDIRSVSAVSFIQRNYYTEEGKL